MEELDIGEMAANSVEMLQMAAEKHQSAFPSPGKNRWLWQTGR